MGSHDWLAGGLIAFVVATITTPAGVSGAVFLLPVQVSLLHVPNPSLTPTNLLYNVFATPGALLRFARSGGRPAGASRARGLDTPLVRALLRGTIPGVVIGAVVRVEILSGPTAFLVVVAAVLAPLGAWLAVGPRPAPSRESPAIGPRISVIAFFAGVVGGIYGIGGGSLLGPALATLGFSMYAIAPAALMATFVTSVAGVISFQLLQVLHGSAAIAPEWILGASMGVGGLAGSYLGARLQPRVPEQHLRRLLGVLCLALAVRYAVQGITG